jgi:GNAT superfamily N-acetyltransferase
MMKKENVVFPGNFNLESVKTGLRRYRPPDGRLLIAELDAVPIGVGALRSLGGGIIEVKRMYVRPDRRGLHAGSRILDALIEEARGMKALKIRLDSAWFMGGAQSLYRSRGFVQRGPYEGTEIPPDLQSRWNFFEKSL